MNDEHEIKQVSGHLLAANNIDLVDVKEYPWRKMSQESTLQYNYFKAYLNLDTPRKIDKLARMFRLSGGNGLRKYSASNRWLERAAAYDDYLLGKETDKKRKLQEISDQKWLERREVQREEEWQLGQMMLGKVREMLKTPIFEQTISETMEGLDVHGRIILKQVIINKPLNWSPSDMAKFLEVASKVMRLSTGAETDRKKIVIDVTKLSDEELDALVSGRG